MKFPSVIVSALLAAAVVFLQYLLGHVDAFGLNSLYAPIAVVIINTLIKMVQEWRSPEQMPVTRGLNGEPAQDSYAARVLYK